MIPLQEFQSVQNACEQLRELLRIALDDFEGTHGRPNAERFPDHWAVRARALTGRQETK